MTVEFYNKYLDKIGKHPWVQEKTYPNHELKAEKWAHFAERLLQGLGCFTLPRNTSTYLYNKFASIIQKACRVRCSRKFLKQFSKDAPQSVCVILNNDSKNDRYEPTLKQILFCPFIDRTEYFFGITPNGLKATSHSPILGFIHELLHAEHHFRSRKTAEYHQNAQPAFAKCNTLEEQITILGIRNEFDLHTKRPIAMCENLVAFALNKPLRLTHDVYIFPPNTNLRSVNLSEKIILQYPFSALELDKEKKPNEPRRILLPKYTYFKELSPLTLALYNHCSVTIEALINAPDFSVNLIDNWGGPVETALGLGKVNEFYLMLTKGKLTIENAQKLTEKIIRRLPSLQVIDDVTNYHRMFCLIHNNLSRPFPFETPY